MVAVGVKVLVGESDGVPEEVPGVNISCVPVSFSPVDEFSSIRFNDDFLPTILKPDPALRSRR